MKITYSISKNALFKQSADTYLMFVKQFDGNFSETACFVKDEYHSLKSSFSRIESFLKKHSFSGRVGEISSIPLVFGEEHAMCILIGLGKSETCTTELYRRAVACGIKKAVTFGANSAVISLPFFSHESFTPAVAAKETTEICEMTTYLFCDFFSATREHEKERQISQIMLVANAEHEKEIEKGMREGEIVGRAVNKVRYVVDMPPSHMTPTIVAEHAEKMAQEYGVTCTIYDYKAIKEMKMGGIHAVARGSVEEPRLVQLEYLPKHAKNKKPILLVGKGITFDSGGLSLKPAAAMETMKDDMAGASAVMMALFSAAQLQLPLSLVALMPLSENMPSGSATKPGDIITFYNGKTAEVKNTDAEGRLVLADALSFGIKKYEPEVVIDLATLTGACAHALGPFYTGLFSEHENLVSEIKQAGEISGDYVWRLPMGDDYKKAIKSHVADLCNIGDSRVKAGASTAAHFLQHFVGSSVWAHLDIAGTAFDVPGIPYYRPGATGVGVRLLVEFLKKRT